MELQISHCVYRLYREEGLNLRKKAKRRQKSACRAPSTEISSSLNECWAMDFVSDQLYNGKRFRTLTLIDLCSRECLALHADKNITGEAVATVLDQVCQTRGLPKRIKMDNEPESISKALDAWAYFNHVRLDYSRPGTPTDNAYIESFNGSFRDECLNANWFMSLEDAREKISRWKYDYNEFRPQAFLYYNVAHQSGARHRCRDKGISEAIYYRWKKEYNGLHPDQAKRLKKLEKENNRLKKLLAEAMLDNQILKDINSGNF